MTEHMHLQITAGFNLHWSRAASYPGTDTIILSFYIKGVLSNGNKCNANVILRGLDSIKTHWQKQYYAKYRHTQMKLGNTFSEAISEDTVL